MCGGPTPAGAVMPMRAPPARPPQRFKTLMCYATLISILHPLVVATLPIDTARGHEQWIQGSPHFCHVCNRLTHELRRPLGASVVLTRWETHKSCRSQSARWLRQHARVFTHGSVPTAMHAHIHTLDAAA